MVASADRGVLRAELGLFGAVMMGLGAIVGTGVFVSIGIGAGVAGPAVVLSIAIAAAVAACNGLSSAQLAAAHPVSGGTYEYGYRYLNGTLGFVAGWTFLCAKSASAATAALGFAGYFIHFFELQLPPVPLALVAVAALTAIVLGGIRRSNHANIAIVSITMLSLLLFITIGAGTWDRAHFSPFFERADGAVSSPLSMVLNGAALMFVAFTGYGRIATMAEEVREPRRTIPVAIIVTLFVSALLYILVAGVAFGAGGPAALWEATTGAAAPLVRIAEGFQWPMVARIVAVGAITAMLGVLLNLVLGLSRVLLAMGRRRDMPALFESVHGSTPRPAVVAVALIIAALVLTGDVKLTWSFSAFTVLIYYAVTNAAAIAMPREQRLYPVAVAWCGLGACLVLAFWVEARVWIFGSALIAVGVVARRLIRGKTTSAVAG